jgi:hypothetical protein
MLLIRLARNEWHAGMVPKRSVLTKRGYAKAEAAEGTDETYSVPYCQEPGTTHDT